jgi:hypothetical protein
MITLTGLDYPAFLYLCQKFAPIFDTYSPFGYRNGDEVLINKAKTGRKRVIRPEDCLGLCLAWTHTRGSLNVLQLIFGMTMSNVWSYLRYGKRIVIEVLKNDDLAKISLPSAEKVGEYCAAVKRRHHDLDMVWSTMDGIKLTLQVASSDDVQRMFYNGWTPRHYVGSQNDLVAANGTSEQMSLEIRQKLACTSMRQSAEWGMRGMRSSFPRLNDKIRFEEAGERKIDMKLMVLLFNLRSRLVGINQIRNVYMPYLDRSANYIALQQ